MTDLRNLQQGWEHAARRNAMHYILTEPQPAGGWTADEFFATGVAEISAVVRRVDELELRLGPRAAALDFGCGIGRLTQALAAHYERCVGVEISEEMVRQARDLNRLGERCTYLVNLSEDLSQFDRGSFDLVYSAQVLMHMPRDAAQRYVAEFLRVLAPGGLAVFQVPEGPDTSDHPEHWLSVYCTAQRAVEGWVSQAGGRVVDVLALGPERVGDVAVDPYRCFQYTALAPSHAT